MRGGDPIDPVVITEIAQLFPACAGVILSLLCRVMELKPFPRMRGGDPDTGHTMTITECFSPHARG